MKNQFSKSARSSRVLFFDVETTGLLPPKSEQVVLDRVMLEKYPYILQLSFIVFNLMTRTIEHDADYYIRPPKHVNIEPKITELTGITREMCDTRGVPIETAMTEFCHYYSKCDAIVSHNLSFDSKMIRVEQLRNNGTLYIHNPEVLTMFNPIYDDLTGRETFCTMKASVSLCNIQAPRKYGGGTYVKWPTLAELYMHLFAEEPKNLHNSIVDTLVGLRCYLKLRHDVDMTDVEFDRLMDQYICREHETYGSATTTPLNK